MEDNNPEELCEDEGCPNANIPHVCVPTSHTFEDRPCLLPARLRNAD